MHGATIKKILVVYSAIHTKHINTTWWYVKEQFGFRELKKFESGNHIPVLLSREPRE